MLFMTHHIWLPNILWIPYNLWLTHHLWLTHNICGVVIFAYYPTPPNFVCVLAVIFQVFTTRVQMQNLIWVLLRSPFSPSISWVVLNHRITLFIVKYMIQWDERIRCFFCHILRLLASYSGEYFP